MIQQEVKNAALARGGAVARPEEFHEAYRLAYLKAYGGANPIDGGDGVRELAGREAIDASDGREAVRK